MHEMQAPEQVATYAQIRWSGMEILARREHSRLELLRKLQLRYPDSQALIGEVIDDLQLERLQSEERYTESYTAMRKRKGYGPQRLQQELREKGIEPSLAQEELSRPEHDWFAQAELALRKKFAEPAVELRERSRQLRFLQYRGFSFDQIQAAMRLDRR